PIAADGSIGALFNATPLPVPVSFGEAVAVDDWLFVIGGRAQVFGAAGTRSVYAAPIAADGSLGAWSTLAELPQGRTNHDAVVGGNYLYVTGGGYDGPGLDTVFATRARFLP